MDLVVHAKVTKVVVCEVEVRRAAGLTGAALNLVLVEAYSEVGDLVVVTLVIVKVVAGISASVQRRRQRSLKEVAEEVHIIKEVGGAVSVWYLRSG